MAAIPDRYAEPGGGPAPARWERAPPVGRRAIVGDLRRTRARPATSGAGTGCTPWRRRGCIAPSAARRGRARPGTPGSCRRSTSRTPGGPVLRPMALRLDRLHGPLWLGRIAVPPGATPPPTAGRDAARMSDAMAWFATAARLAAGRRVGRAGRADHRAAGARRRVRAARRRPLAAGARRRVRCRGGDAAGQQAADRRHRARRDRRGDRGRPRRRGRPLAAARRRLVGRPAP